VNLPRFGGHFTKDTLVMKGVSNEKAEAVYPGVYTGGSWAV